MKKKLFIAAGVAMLTLAACKNKAVEENVANDTIVADSTAADATEVARPDDVVPEPDAPKEGDTITVSGAVTEITNGKDGYMAKIKRNEHSYYTVTVSIVNLKDPKQFKRAAVGEEINATGEVFMLGDEIGVKATSFEVKK